MRLPSVAGAVDCVSVGDLICVNDFPRCYSFIYNVCRPNTCQHSLVDFFLSNSCCHSHFIEFQFDDYDNDDELEPGTERINGNFVTKISPLQCCRFG